MPIGKLESVPLRELWKHEERGFSAWLADNIEALADELGIELADVSREQREGAFPVDLVARDEQGNRVIVENQLEPTDHDHLGKLITHLTNWDAKTAVWITKQARPEHVRAVQWLNEVSPEDVSFYLVRLAAYRIGDSDPAPQFTVIVGSVHESKALGREKKELSEREHLYEEFWAKLKARASQQGLNVHANTRPGPQSWLSAAAGYPSCQYVYTFTAKRDVEVILGRDLVYDPASAQWIGQPQHSQDSIVKRSKADFAQLAKQVYRVLMTRGLKGCYVYFEDKDTENFVRSRLEIGQ